MEDEFAARRLKAQRDRLFTDIAALTGESADDVVLLALEERLARLTTPGSAGERKQRLLNVLETSVWSHSRRVSGRVLTRDEEDKILGYGPEGV